MEKELEEITKKLEKNEIYSFDELSVFVKDLHQIAYSSAVKAINRFATIRNFLIGFYIVEYEQNGKDRATYGEKLLKRLEEKVKTKGLNETLFKNCRKFYLNYPQVKDFLLQKSPTASDKFIPSSDHQIGATASHFFETPAEKLISNLSFSHIREILTIDDKFERFFYETECIKCCWSVKELRRQISTNLFFRSGISENPQNLLSQTVQEKSLMLGIKEPFTFEFLGLNPKTFNENELENALIDHLQDFLLELGKGFCFEARQKRMIIDDEYYYADLVFYNRILHCSVIIELKDDEFKHENLGQLNAYVSYFKENEMNAGDNPPIGILLCTKKGKKMVEYALAGMDNNLFVSTYKLTLPDTKVLEEFLLNELKNEN